MKLSLSDWIHTINSILTINVHHPSTWYRSNWHIIRCWTLVMINSTHLSSLKCHHNPSRPPPRPPEKPQWKGCAWVEPMCEKRTLVPNGEGRRRMKAHGRWQVQEIHVITCAAFVFWQRDPYYTATLSCFPSNRSTNLRSVSHSHFPTRVTNALCYG